MSRGPEPQKAKEESLEIAGRRGHVQRYMHRKGNLCEFSIMCPGIVCFVTAMRLLKLSSTPEDILHDYAKVIGQLRFIASSPAISRELWLRTPRGAWRFFRVLSNSIIELDCSGMPLANGAGPVSECPASTIVITVPVPGAGLKNGQNGPMTAAGIPRNENDPVELNRKPSADNVPTLQSAPVPEPEKDPAPLSRTAGPVAENAGNTGSAPAPITDLANNPGNPEETDTSRFPGINLELIRRFMRWRKERQKKDRGPG